MRIAMLHATFAVRGGAERYLDDVAAALALRGHEVRVYSDTPRLSARLGERLPGKLGTGVVHLGDLADPTGLGLRDLRDFRPDVVHLHNWQGLGVLPVARIAGRYPTVHTVHDHAILDPNNTLATLGRWRALDALLRLRSRWILRRYRDVTLVYAAQRTRDRIRAGVRDRLLPMAVPGRPVPLPPGRRDVFLYLGALSPHKGLGGLLDAWDPALGTLLVGGAGPMRRAVEAAGESVCYLGYLDDAGKRAAFARAGWLVFPSRGAETFGLVCAEALAAGRPVIAPVTARPPMATPGSLLLYDRPADLHGMLSRAAAMPVAEYAAMAAAAAADGRALDWDRHVEALLAIYRDAAS